MARRTAPPYLIQHVKGYIKMKLNDDWTELREPIDHVANEIAIMYLDPTEVRQIEEVVNALLPVYTDCIEDDDDEL